MRSPTKWVRIGEEERQSERASELAMMRDLAKSVTTTVGVHNDEDPPVPIPNTEVKLISADDT